MVEPELLDARRIESGLRSNSRSLLAELIVEGVLDSTNAEVLRRMQRGAVGGLVCLAEQQSAGRGRRGRQWVSPFGANIYLSAAWEFTSAAALEGLSLAVGVAVAAALRSVGLPSATLKWPNDVLCDGAKLGGILVEMVGDATGACKIVVGIGLNVRMPPQAVADIDQQWTDVETAAGVEVSRNQIVIALLDELLPLLATYESGGFLPWREPWLALDAHAGREVTVSGGEQHTKGIARGIDATGALIVETETGEQIFHGGEVSVRALR